MWAIAFEPALAIDTTDGYRVCHQTLFALVNRARGEASARDLDLAQFEQVPLDQRVFHIDQFRGGCFVARVVHRSGEIEVFFVAGLPKFVAQFLAQCAVPRVDCRGHARQLGCRKRFHSYLFPIVDLITLPAIRPNLA